MSTPTGLEMLPLLIGPVEEPAEGVSTTVDTTEEDDTVPDAEIVEEGEEPKRAETAEESRA